MLVSLKKRGFDMARIRTIKPDFWTDEKIVTLSPLARLLFIGLWNFADDEGRMPYSPVRIKLQILPLDHSDLSGEIGELRRANLITVYDIGAETFLQVTNFSKHQKVDKRLPSRHPAPTPNHPESPRITPTEGNGMEEEREKEAQQRAQDSDSFFKKVCDLIERDYPALLFKDMHPVNKWRDEGADFERHVVPVLKDAKRRNLSPSSVAYFTPMVMAAMQPVQKPSQQIPQKPHITKRVL